MYRHKSVLDTIGQASKEYAAGQHTAAIARLRDATRRWPEDPQIVAALGSSLLDTRKDEAKRCFTKSAELAWDDPTALISAVRGMADLANWDEVARFCRRIEALAPSEFACQPELDYFRGIRLRAVDEPGQALPLLVRSYDAMPDYDHGRALIDAYLELKTYDMLRPLVEHALETDASNREYLLDLKAWMIEEQLWHQDPESGH